MWSQTVKVLTAIICLTVLELYAMSKGIDGYLLSVIVAMISGLAGYEVKVLKEKIKKEEK